MDKRTNVRLEICQDQQNSDLREIPSAGHFNVKRHISVNANSRRRNNTDFETTLSLRYIPAVLLHIPYAPDNVTNLSKVFLSSS